MAHISEIMYKETRNPDGSLFSHCMQASVVLKEGELPYPLNEQDQADAVVLREGGLLVEWVRQNLDNPFKRADEQQPAPPSKPVELPGAAPKETPKAAELSPNSMPGYDAAHKVWLFCPNNSKHQLFCPNNSKHQIRQLQTQRGKTQMCEQCGVWLNPDGKLGKMKEAK
jgi:hypothetical protein